jgi:hypothetical protein
MYICVSLWGCRGRDRTVGGFTTTCAISAYHHQHCEFEPHSWQGVLDTTLCDRFRFMVLNATFNNISDISWQSVLLVEETGVPGKNHRPATSH